MINMHARTLLSVLDTEQKRLVYHVNDWTRGTVDMTKPARISSTSTVFDMWQTWLSLAWERASRKEEDHASSVLSIWEILILKYLELERLKRSRYLSQLLAEETETSEQSQRACMHK